MRELALYHQSISLGFPPLLENLHPQGGGGTMGGVQNPKKNRAFGAILLFFLTTFYYFLAYLPCFYAPETLVLALVFNFFAPAAHFFFSKRFVHV